MSGDRPIQIDLFSNQLRRGILNMRTEDENNQRRRSEQLYAQHSNSSKFWSVDSPRNKCIPLHCENLTQSAKAPTHYNFWQCIFPLICIASLIAFLTTLVVILERSLQMIAPTLNSAQPLMEGIREAIQLVSRSEIPTMVVNETVPLLNVARTYLEHPPTLHIDMHLDKQL